MTEGLDRETRRAVGVLLIAAGAVGMARWSAGAPIPFVWIVVAAALLVAGYLMLAESLVIAVLWRTVAALIPVIGITGAVIGFLILPFEGPEGVRPALIAGTVLAAGWLAAFLAAEYKKAREREEARGDTMLALRAEIFTIVEKLDDKPIVAAAATVRQSIARGGSGARAYHFFSSSESPTTVYDAVAGNIVLLSPEVLEPVVRFYAAYSDLSAFVGDVRTDHFRTLPADRRKAAHIQLTRHRIATLVWGLRALYALNVAIKVPSPEQIPRSGRNTDIDRNTAP